MFGLKHGKVGDNINIFKPGYHVITLKMQLLLQGKQITPSL
jgi:hypothetical protein